MTENLPDGIQSFSQLTDQFEYDRTRTLQIREASKERRDSAEILDLSYSSLGKELIDAYWVSPIDAGAFPAVIYVHPAPGNRTTFLDEAVMLAGRGTAAMVVNAPWSQPAVFGDALAEPEQARQILSLFIKDLHRAVDFVTRQPGVDTSMLGFVGHSLGAHIGGVLSGVEKRIRAFVLMAGTASIGDVVALNMPFLEKQALDEYLQMIAVIDPIYYVSRAAPSALFFQFGSKDEAFSRDQFTRFAEAGSSPKRVEWYETGHFFEDEKARQDRLEWLNDRLRAG